MATAIVISNSNWTLEAYIVSQPGMFKKMKQDYAVKSDTSSQIVFVIV